MTQSKPVRVLIAVLILAALAAGLWWGTHRNRQPVSSALSLYGNVDIRQSQLAFNGSGRIARLLAVEGERVRKGELLGQLDTQRLEDSVAQAESVVAAQQEVVAKLHAGSRPEEIRKARADTDATAIDARNAEHTYERLKALAERHFVAQQQADDARAAAAAALARQKSAQEALKLVIAGPRQEDIAAAEATLKANEAALALAKRALADASLYAPADGVVQDRIMEPGDMTTPQQPVYTLALTDPMWVRTYVSGSDLGKLRPGMKAYVSTDSFPGKRYEAWVGFISPTAEFTPKAVETSEVRTSLVYQVRVFVCASDGELRLGMPATVTIPLAEGSGNQETGVSPCRKPQ